MTLEDRLHGAGTTVPVDGVFERVQRLRAARRKQRVIRKAMAGVTAVAAIGATVFVIAQRKDEGHRIVTDQGTTTTTTSAVRRAPEVSALQPMSSAESAAVTKVTEAFFDSKATAATRQTLLEHGPELRPTLDAMDRLPGGLPFGPWSAPKVTVLGQVGDTAVVDIALDYAGADPATDPSSAPTSTNLVAHAKISEVRLVRSSDRWRIAATSWCHVLEVIPATTEKVLCSDRLSALVRMEEGEAEFGSLDQTSGRVLQPEVDGAIPAAIQLEGNVNVSVPGIPGTFVVGTTANSSGDFPTSAVAHYSATGEELGHLMLDGTVKALEVDSSVAPAALWAHVQSGTFQQSTHELVRISPDLSGISARVRLPGSSSVQGDSGASSDEFLPLGASVAIVDLGFQSATPRVGPVDLVTLNLEGKETARIRLVDRATPARSENFHSSVDAETNAAVWRGTMLSQVDLGGELGIAVSDGSQVWIVNLATGQIVTDARPTDRGISAMRYSNRLYLLTYDLADQNGPDQPPWQVETVDFVSGRRSTMFDSSGGYDCDALIVTPKVNRLWLSCQGPQARPGGSSEEVPLSSTTGTTGGTFENYNVPGVLSTFLYEIDTETGGIERTVIWTGGSSVPFLPIQPDPNALLYRGYGQSVLRVVLPPETSR